MFTSEDRAFTEQSEMIGALNDDVVASIGRTTAVSMYFPAGKSTVLPDPAALRRLDRGVDSRRIVACAVALCAVVAGH